MIYSPVQRETTAQSDPCRKLSEILSEDVFYHVRLLLWIAAHHIHVLMQSRALCTNIPQA